MNLDKSPAKYMENGITVSFGEVITLPIIVAGAYTGAVFYIGFSKLSIR